MTRIAALAALLLGASVSATAQMPPAADTGETADTLHAGNPMFAGMSDAGRLTMRSALKGADPQAGRAATEAARDHMLAVLDADRLDVVALKRAMDDEREASNAAKVRHQTAMIAGFQQLSPADRRIFVANARAVRARMESRTLGWQSRHNAGAGGMMPPQ